MRALLSVFAFALGCAACSGGRDTGESHRVETGGEPDRGAQLIGRYGCGSCHTIPGIRAANGLVGPPLTSFSRRSYIAGELPNSPDNLVKWIVDPPAVEPKTAMPKLGLSASEARDVAAYLYTLR